MWKQTAVSQQRETDKSQIFASQKLISYQKRKAFNIPKYN